MTDARVLRTRARLRAALLELVREQQLDTITVADIVARADVGYATFFRHYPSRQELWGDIADQLIDESLTRIEELVRLPEAGQLSQHICAFVARHREPFTAILAPGSIGTVQVDITRRATALTEKRAMGAIVGWPRELAISHTVNATVNAVTWWLNNYDLVSVGQMTEIIERLVTGPFKTGLKSMPHFPDVDTGDRR